MIYTYIVLIEYLKLQTTDDYDHFKNNNKKQFQF